VDEKGNKFTVASGECLHVWKICRDLNFVELTGHQEALLSIVSVRSSPSSSNYNNTTASGEVRSNPKKIIRSNVK
jgi:hypothetical protein